MQFRKGDRVRCIRNARNFFLNEEISIGNIYEVQEDQLETYVSVTFIEGNKMPKSQMTFPNIGRWGIELFEPTYISDFSDKLKALTNE